MPFWPLDPGWVKNQDPDPWWTTRIIFPRYLNSLILIRDGKDSDPGWKQFGSATLIKILTQIPDCLFFFYPGCRRPRRSCGWWCAPTPAASAAGAGNSILRSFSPSTPSSVIHPAQDRIMRMNSSCNFKFTRDVIYLKCADPELFILDPTLQIISFLDPKPR